MTIRRKVSSACIWMAVAAASGAGSVGARAQDALPPRDNPLLGRWRETFKLGSMVTTFAENSISTDSFDGDGHLVPGKTNAAPVHYTRLDKSVGVVFDGGDGRSGFLVVPQDPTHILLDFPGMGVHRLVPRVVHNVG